MALKVYIHLELPGYPEKTSKLTIPKTWVASKTIGDIVKLFLEGYNSVNLGSDPLSHENFHLETAITDGIKFYSDSPLRDHLEDRGDYFILNGSHVFSSANQSTDKKIQANNKLKCKNYGCNKQYLEEENTETSCSFHSLPPFFRDTVKGWQCCKDSKAYDWEEFQVKLLYFPILFLIKISFFSNNFSSSSN
jgi:hypothetical protein